MKLCQRVRVFLLGKAEDLIELHGVAAVFAGLARVGALAKLAVDRADIRVVDVAIDVEVGLVAVQALPHDIGNATYGCKLRRSIEGNAVLERQAFSALHLFGNGLQATHRRRIILQIAMARRLPTVPGQARLSITLATDAAVTGARRMPFR